MERVGAENRGRRRGAADATAYTSIAEHVLTHTHTHTHTRVFHDKFYSRLKPKRYDEARTLLFGWKEAHRAGSVAIASSGLYGAGDAFCFPPGAPLTQPAPAAPSGCQVHKFVGSAVHRELEVLCCSRQSLQNRRDRRLDPRPTVRCAADRSPRDTASATLAFDGTRRKSGSQSDCEAVAQNDARMPFTAGSLPYPLVRAHWPATLSMNASHR